MYAYDHARANEIAPGVKVGGVALGGLTPDQARARLEREILQPLERPIVVHHAAKTWKLGPREARLRADLGAMVDEALARSRTGNIFARSWRSLLGPADRTTTSSRPSSTPTRRSSASSTRCASRSSARPRTRSVKIAARGRQHRPRASRGSPSRPRSCTARSAPRSPRRRRRAPSWPTTRHTQPKVTTADLKRKYDTVIVVNRGQFRLRLFKALKPTQTYGIAVGQVGLETPAGQYTIANKAINPAWHVPNSAWAGQAGRQGHRRRRPQQPDQGALAGDLRRRRHPRDLRRRLDRPNASHGCIRMHIPDVEKLYDEVPVGAAGLHRLAPGRHRRISSIGTSSHPRSRSRAWWEECRSTSVPMKTPRSRLRMTANHNVEASGEPWMRCHGRGGCPSAPTAPASMSWRWVAT